MDHIEKMAAECMKDLNEDEEEEADDEDLEKDTDLLVCITLLARSLVCFSFFKTQTTRKLHVPKMSINFVVRG